jgi:phage FluMu gp28-like protein
VWDLQSNSGSNIGDEAAESGFGQFGVVGNQILNTDQAEFHADVHEILHSQDLDIVGDDGVSNDFASASNTSPHDEIARQERSHAQRVCDRAIRMSAWSCQWLFK